MSKATRLIAIPLIALLAANANSMAGDKPKTGKASKTSKNPKETLPTDTLVTQTMAEAALDLPCPGLQFPGENPLSEILEAFEEHWGKHLSYDVPFFPDYTELDLEGITSLEDVAVRNIKITAGTHTCRDALDLIFLQTTDPQLAYQPVPGHIQVTTLAKAESEDNLLSRVYDVGEFIGGPSEKSEKQDGPSTTKKGRKKKNNAKQQRSAGSPQKVLKQFGGGGLGGGGLSANQNVSTTNDDTQSGITMSTMIQLLQEQTSPPAKWFTIDAEGGNISIVGQYLIVRQTPAVHRHIEDILNQLRTAIKIGGAPYIKTDPSYGGGMGGGGGQHGGGLGGGGFGGGGGVQQGGGGGGGGGFFQIK